jgi:hypothetical protein
VLLQIFTNSYLLPSISEIVSIDDVSDFLQDIIGIKSSSNKEELKFIIFDSNLNF